MGDNYNALTNLLITHRNKIKVIYIDPPYGKDHMGEYAKTNYDNAITRDNLLSMLYARLQLAKQLLSDDGVIFCSIDDRNQAYVKCLFDEVFGERNFIANLVWLKGNAQNDANGIQRNHEYILCYAKNMQCNPINKINQKVKVRVFCDEKTGKFYYEGSGFTSGNVDSDLNHHNLCGYTIYYNHHTQDIKCFMDYDVDKAKISNISEEVYYELDTALLDDNYVAIRPPKKGELLGRWCVSFETFLKLIEEQRILIKPNKKGYSILRKEWLDSRQVKQDKDEEYFAWVEKENPPQSFVDFASSSRGTTQLKDIMKNKVFSNPKNIALLIHLLKISTQSKNDIVLDFFAGSGTTAHAVMELNRQDGGNRQCILVTNNEITDLNPNGIAYDVTAKRLKRIMSGECYDGTKDFKWLEKNEPYNDGLEVLEIKELSATDEKIFDSIDGSLYGRSFLDINDKIEWVCENFERTCYREEVKDDKN